jgi:hypothetical protein
LLRVENTPLKALVEMFPMVFGGGWLVAGLGRVDQRRYPGHGAGLSVQLGVVNQKQTCFRG